MKIKNTIKDLKKKKSVRRLSPSYKLECYNKHPDYSKDAPRSNPTLLLVSAKAAQQQPSSKNSHDIPSASTSQPKVGCESLGVFALELNAEFKKIISYYYTLLPYILKPK